MDNFKVVFNHYFVCGLKGHTLQTLKLSRLLCAKTYKERIEICY